MYRTTSSACDERAPLESYYLHYMERHPAEFFLPGT
jgi:hypothetical protein